MITYCIIIIIINSFQNKTLFQFQMHMILLDANLGDILFTYNPLKNHFILLGIDIHIKYAVN